MDSEITYAEAFAELTQIMNAFERDEVTIEELTGKVSRAVQLMKICKTKLDRTEEDVRHILKEFYDTSSNKVPSDNASSK
ncbi:MAG: exodeoxyribonuclease VII small subunit [Tannerella sp.]|jgi:exodeoxyribonuclease VII small subunit|nr:exodeoxyribonuclease VII small subunit [Tannerella sp.]